MKKLAQTRDLSRELASEVKKKTELKTLAYIT
jgi:hypothetical protein